MSIYGLNHGNSTIEAGDIVSISECQTGYVKGTEKCPVLKVEKASYNNPEAVVGVVEYKVIVNEKDKNQDAQSKKFKFNGYVVKPGEYLSIVVFGITDVNINSTVQIKTGQKLTLSESEGTARTVTKSDLWNLGTLGKALENSSGSGKIKAFVNCK